MRTYLAVVLAIVILFVGLPAVQQSADTSEDAAIANGTDASAEAHNMTTELYDNYGLAAGQMLVYGGIGATVLVAIGVLYKSGGGR